MKLKRITYKRVPCPLRYPSTSSTGWTLSLSKNQGAGAECEGRGDIGVRFDRLNELEDGLIPEPVERSKGAATVSKSSAWNSLNETAIPPPTMGAFGDC